MKISLVFKGTASLAIKPSSLGGGCREVRLSRRCSGSSDLSGATILSYLLGDGESICTDDECLKI